MEGPVEFNREISSLLSEFIRVKRFGEENDDERWDR